MVLAQLERLKKDSEELDIYAKRLEKKGHIQRADKIKQKRSYLIKTMESLYGNQLQNST